MKKEDIGASMVMPAMVLWPSFPSRIMLFKLWAMVERAPARTQKASCQCQIKILFYPIYKVMGLCCGCWQKMWDSWTRNKGPSYCKTANRVSTSMLAQVPLTLRFHGNHQWWLSRGSCHSWRALIWGIHCFYSKP
jgi:hypothetical protein